MASVATTVLLNLVTSAFARFTDLGGALLFFFCLSLIGHRLKNYLWVNLFGIALLVAIKFLENSAVSTREDYGVLACLILSGFVNAKAMLLLRRFGQPAG